MDKKPKPEEIKLIPPEAFEREAAILFKVSPAEINEAEAKRPKRANRKKPQKENPLKNGGPGQA